MGSVYRAVQLAHERSVAIKLLSESYRDDGEFVARFRREAASLVALEHPHIVPLLDSGTVDGVPFIVMHFIDGPNLRELIRIEQPTHATIVRILGGVAAALDFAHHRGVLHRDVKPHNILVDHGDHAWLADFGLTEMAIGSGGRRPGASDVADGHGGADPALAGSASGARVYGSIDYLAPEVVAGAGASASSDVYALAVTAFQVLTGALPFPRPTVGESIDAHAREPRPAASAIDPSVPAGVDAVLAAGMAVAPKDRPSSATELVDALAAAVASPVGVVRHRRRWRAPPARQLAPPGSVASVESVDSDAHTRLALRSGPPAAPPDASSGTRSTPGTRRLGARWLLAGALLAVAAVAAVLLGAGPPRHARTLASAGRDTAEPGVPETPGGPSHTWFDFAHARGSRGAILAAHQAVLISCRLPGLRVSDGNVWWYRIASLPWDQQFYVSADAFYNNGRTRGSLLHTPFYDPRVPVCTSYAEIPGNAHGTTTWTDYQTAEGGSGAPLPGFRPVAIACRLRGLPVSDGNPWWYRIAARPWSGRFYASADAFYNNGRSHGTLVGPRSSTRAYPCARAGAP